MNDQPRVVDLIERANDQTRFCPCGRHTAPIWRDGVVWLECASLSDPERRGIRRILHVMTTPAHVHVPIVDLRELTGSESAAA
jgi:hypothetical protein